MFSIEEPRENYDEIHKMSRNIASSADVMRSYNKRVLVRLHSTRGTELC